MLIDYEVVPYDQMRYETIGDYWYGVREIADAKGGEPRMVPTLFIRVAKMSDSRYEWLVFIHEMIELTLARIAGIEEPVIKLWDENYEYAREVRSAAACGCEVTEDSEPGEDPHAPYHKQHVLAEICERTVAFFLGVSWVAYTAEVMSF